MLFAGGRVLLLLIDVTGEPKGQAFFNSHKAVVVNIQTIGGEIYQPVV